MSVAVVQSHRSPLPHAWIEQCLGSVRDWAELRGYDYRFYGDDIFDALPTDLVTRQDLNVVVKSDLARLLVAKKLLQQFDTVVWLDADVFILDIEGFQLPVGGIGVGRENWIQFDAKGNLRNYRKVHNAAMSFTQDDSLIAFYIDTATRLLRANTAAMPVQFIGPKLLTALHNVAQLPVWESVGMMSPLVGKDILGKGSGKALTMFNEAHSAPVMALNLCSSSCQNGELSDEQMFSIINRLKQGCLNRRKSNL